MNAVLPFGIHLRGVDAQSHQKCVSACHYNFAHQCDIFLFHCKGHTIYDEERVFVKAQEKDLVEINGTVENANADLESVKDLVAAKDEQFGRVIQEIEDKTTRSGEETAKLPEMIQKIEDKTVCPGEEGVKLLEIK